ERSLVEYIIALANATRHHESLQVGLSPRGSLALAQAARATAILRGRDYAIPEDILENIMPVCAHRMVAKSYLQDGAVDSATRILKTIVEPLKSPACPDAPPHQTRSDRPLPHQPRGFPQGRQAHLDLRVRPLREDAVLRQSPQGLRGRAA